MRIYGDRLYGPLSLINQSGPIDVTLPDQVAGPSSITASHGTVKLTLSPESNLLLTATTVGGEIQSLFPVKIGQKGITKTAELSLGDAGAPLMVSGDSSTIIIYKAPQ